MNPRRIRSLWRVLACAVFLVLFLAGLLVVTMGRRADPTEFAKGPMVYWMPPAALPKGQSEEDVMADLLDPSLLALPSRHGFSRELWDHALPAAHRSFDPIPLLAFLDVEAPSNALSLLEPSPLNDLVQSSTVKSSADSEEAADEEPTPTAPMNHSVVQIVEPVYRQSVMRSPQLPALESDAALRPTRVRVAVAADGVVRYALLDRSAGSGAASPAADAQALESALRIRFEPRLDGAERTLSWGLLRFVWATIPTPAPTNESMVAAP